MIIEFLIVFALGCWIGSWVRGAWMALSFREILRDLGVTEQQLRKLAEKNQITFPVENPRDSITGEITLTPMEIRLEKIGDQIFAYRLDTDQFLGQGADRDALIQRLTENLTNVRLIIAQEDGADLLEKRHT
jgi:hypothetical protein